MMVVGTTGAAAVRTSYRSFEIAALGLPSHGGGSAVEALNVLEEAEIGKPIESPESLFWWMQITNLFVLGHMTPDQLRFMVPGREVTPRSRATKEWARWIWNRMRDGKLLITRAPEEGTHSDAVVAVDRRGNAVAGVASAVEEGAVAARGAQSSTAAMQSISTSASFGRRATCTAARAGGFSPGKKDS